ncbi:MAG: universal stress protein, partial [Verrucomicrobiota bacterium]
MSVSRALLRHTPMNLLVVPAGAGIAKIRLPQFSLVLVAVDFSDVSSEAVLNGCALLSPGGRLHLVHVVDPGGSPHGKYEAAPIAVSFGTRHADHINRYAERLSALIPVEAEKRGLITEVEVSEHREPAKAICQAAERFGADALCLGTHGHSGWSAILGSVTQSVLRQSSRPLFIVHPLPA